MLGLEDSTSWLTAAAAVAAPDSATREHTKEEMRKG